MNSYCVLLFAGQILKTCGAVLIFISLLTIDWMIFSPAQSHHGVFKVCEETCTDIQPNSETPEGRNAVFQYDAVRALLVTSLSTTSVSFWVNVIFLCCDAKGVKCNSHFAALDFVLCIATAALTSAACAVYSEEIFARFFLVNEHLQQQGDVTLGFSFYLAGAGGPVVLVGGVATLVAAAGSPCIRNTMDNTNPGSYIS